MMASHAQQVGGRAHPAPAARRCIRAESKTLGRVVPAGLLADVARQVTGRVHRGVEHHAGAACVLRHPAGVEAAQRRADDRHGARGQGCDACATSAIAAWGEGGSCGHQKVTAGWCCATWAAICRALAEEGDERKPCRYRRCVVVMGALKGCAKTQGRGITALAGLSGHKMFSHEDPALCGVC